MSEKKTKTILTRLFADNGCGEEKDMTVDEYVGRFKVAVRVADELQSAIDELPEAIDEGQPQGFIDLSIKRNERLHAALWRVHKLLRDSYGEALVAAERVRGGKKAEP